MFILVFILLFNVTFDVNSNLHSNSNLVLDNHNLAGTSWLDISS